MRGIIGLSIGLKLQQQGYQVTIFDPNGVGNGCSKGNAGHIATEQIFPLATPALLPQLPKILLDPKSPVSIRWQDMPNTIGDDSFSITNKAISCGAGKKRD